jgi:CubicO group peptidase (beta-lactamase class C family)
MYKLKTVVAVALASMVGFAFGVEKKQSSFAENALKKYIDSGALPGAVSVFMDGDREEIACLGWADVGEKRPISLDSTFMQCSQTKGFCGVTVAILVEEGKIKLDDPVYKYLPEFKKLKYVRKDKKGKRQVVDAKNVLTIRMVMNHTGGFDFELPNYQKMGGWSRRMPLRDVAKKAASIPLLFEPGTKMRYSNVGIDIGATVVEVVTGMPWEDFLKKRVFDPLGMTSSTFKPSDEMLKRRMSLYTLSKKHPPKKIPYDPSMQAPFADDGVFASAGAGLWTTARDQLKFYRMLMNLGKGDNGVRILKEETVKSILAKSTRDKRFGGYSLGLTAPNNDNENQWFGHGGAYGTNCLINWHKKQLKLWAVQLRGGPRPWDHAKNKAADDFFKAKIDNSEVDAYTGRMK